MVAKPKVETDISAIDAARAEADAGKTVPYEDVRSWLLSWDGEKELPRPRCKIAEAADGLRCPNPSYGL